MAPIDLDAYLVRIECDRPASPTAEALAPILLDLEHLQAKLVRDGRGGYCFEQNTLFAEMRKKLGRK